MRSPQRVLGVLAWVLAMGCQPVSNPTGEAPTPPPPPPTQVRVGDQPPAAPDDPPPVSDKKRPRLRGTIELDATAGYKKFQGVWFAAADGKRFVLSYRVKPWARAFEGRSVEVEGETYEPEGQALQVDHFRASRIEVVDPTPDDPLVWIEEERTYFGELVALTGPKGSKQEGQMERVFRADDKTVYRLWHEPSSMPAMNVPVTLKARQVEPSSFVARPGGAYLWVSSANKTP